MSGHTPGPWHLDIGNGGIYAKRGTSFDSEHELVERVATMRPTCVTDVWEADARLIAAAPLMHAALLDCIAALERNHPDIAAQRNAAALNARAAIAKAEGK